MGVVDASFGQPLALEEGAAAPLAGGVMQHGYQCGMLWGAALAAGAQAYRLYGAGARAETEALVASQRLVQAFRERNQHIDCSDLTEMEWKASSNRQMMKQVLKFFLRGGPIVCFSMSASYARIAYRETNLSLSGDHRQVPPQPVSCAALLARKAGACDLHATMAAGFAGGIGLSGSACGALGAAVWLAAMQTSLQGGGKVSYDSPLLTQVIEKYLPIADYEFECAKLVGRKFASVADHADYVRSGGCAQIIQTLAA